MISISKSFTYLSLLISLIVLTISFSVLYANNNTLVKKRNHLVGKLMLYNNFSRINQNRLNAIRHSRSFLFTNKESYLSNYNISRSNTLSYIESFFSTQIELDSATIREYNEIFEKIRIRFQKSDSISKLISSKQLATESRVRILDELDFLDSLVKEEADSRLSTLKQDSETIYLNINQLTIYNRILLFIFFMVGIILLVSLFLYFKSSQKKISQVVDELRKSNDRFKIVGQATNDILFEIDLERRSVLLSESAAPAFKLLPDDLNLSYEGFFSRIHPLYRQSLEDSLKNHIQHKQERWSCEFCCLTSDGELVEFNSRAKILYSQDLQTAYRVVGIMEDVTEKKRIQKTHEEEKENHQKQLLRAIVDSQEKERAEIGKELHDNLSQVLSSTKLFIELIRGNSKYTEELLPRCSDSISYCIEEIRSLSKSLLAPSFGDQMLKVAITGLLDDSQKIKNYKIRFDADRFNESNWTEKQQLTCYRIVQEQLNNIIKYAEATEVEVVLHEEENHLVLIVRDNGRGFDLKQKRNGVGISNIINRAELLNGSAEIITAVSEGCTIRVHIPRSS